MLVAVATYREGLIQVPFGKLDERRFSARYRWDNSHRGKEPFVIVQHTQKGEGVFQLGKKRYPVPAGHAFIAILPEDGCYYFPQEASQPWVFSWVNFYGELAIHLWRALRDQGGPVIALSPRSIKIMRRLCALVVKSRGSDPYRISGEAYQFYLETLRHIPPSREAKLFRDIISHFRVRYQEGMRIKEIADQAHLSREHFTRLFTQEMGCGPAAYLRGIRLEAAARLLRTARLPVAEVALRCGWASTTKLDIFFRRRYGVSPSEYGKRYAVRKLRS